MAELQVLKRGTQHMVNNDGFEPQRTNNYEVQIIGLDNSLRDMKGNAVFQSANAGEIITLSTCNGSGATTKRTVVHARLIER